MKSFLNLLKQSFSEWNSREAPRMGAALAFYSILSLAPLLILIVGICALAFGAAGAQQQILDEFRSMVGSEGARAIEAVLTSAQKPATGILASAFGLVTLLFGASGVFVELRSALNALWEVKPLAAGSGVWSFVKDRFLSFGMVLAIGFLLLISLSLSAVLSAAGKFFSNLGFLPPTVWELVNLIVSVCVIAGMFALIFRFVPDVRLPWPHIVRGAGLTAVLFAAGKTLIGIYLGKAGVGSAYGAAGSLVVLVVWIYYSAQIFFFGATFTRVYALAHGWRPADVVKQPQENAPVTSDVQQIRTKEAPGKVARFAAFGLILAALIRKRKP